MCNFLLAFICLVNNVNCQKVILLHARLSILYEFIACRPIDALSEWSTNSHATLEVTGAPLLQQHYFQRFNSRIDWPYLSLTSPVARILEIFAVWH